jgi:hypothetical protein
MDLETIKQLVLERYETRKALDTAFDRARHGNYREGEITEAGRAASDARFNLEVALNELAGIPLDESIWAERISEASNASSV